MNDADTLAHHDVDAIADFDPSLDRRRFLGAAAGGFAIAASGLLLPAWLEEAEAHEGSYEGALGGRRGQNRRGRDDRKRRTRGDRKNPRRVKDLPLPFRYTAVTVRNGLAEPVPCIFFASHNTGGNNFGPFFKVIEHTVNNDAQDDEYRFDSLELRAGVLIRELNFGKDIFCDLRNLRIGTPRGGVSTGANLDPANGNAGAAYIPEQDFSQGEGKFNQRAVLERLIDDWTGVRRIEWRLTVR